jgi:CRP-like cAMP-binding protein
MIERPVALIVHQAKSCPLMKEGQRWIIAGREVVGGEARLCGSGLCSVYPKLLDLLKSLPPNAGLPDDYLLCDAGGCDTAFRMEFTSMPALAAPKSETVTATATSQPTTILPPPAFAPSQPAPVPVQAHQAMPSAIVAAHTRRLERGAPTATTILRNSGPFLSRLPKELSAELITACKTVRFDSGQIIVMQGVVGEHLHVVAEGFVEVAKRGDNDSETVLVTLGRGDCFGEMSILTGEITSAEVRAKGPAAVLMLHREQLESMLLKRPVLSREFSKLLAERLKATNQSLQSELSRGILGKLSMISLVDLVQTLNQSRRTGTLVLTYFGQEARLGFRNGAMVTGICGDALGEEAFYKVVCWPDGDFCFEQAEPAADAPGKVKTDIMGLMMEGMRRMDEARANGTVPTPNSAPASPILESGK